MDYIETRDKSLILADYLIDDNWDNLAFFRGRGILYTQPWNKDNKYPFRINSWNEFADNGYSVNYTRELLKMPEYLAFHKGI